MRLFADQYRGRKVLLTGHTGFKGAWLAAWLVQLGAEVVGFSLPDTESDSHWRALNLPITDLRGDIRDAASLVTIVEEHRPEIVFHLAAQALVRPSYKQPLDTWSTNVMGTAHLLEACRLVPGVKAIVIVTTDKVYANHEWPWGYRECDELAGHDPYSASKAATELLSESYRKAFWRQGGPLLATARAGNVIGGGDWAEDRLIPDIVRALQDGQPLDIRSPGSTRPWQHVLDCLSGYLLLGQRLLEGQSAFAAPWNFGPAVDANRQVVEVLGLLQHHWPVLRWRDVQKDSLHEARLLYLDNAKARSLLQWRPVWNLETALERTADWYRGYLERRELLTRAQLERFIESALEAGCIWAQR